jgi:hypothetical protein
VQTLISLKLLGIGTGGVKTARASPILKGVESIHALPLWGIQKETMEKEPSDSRVFKLGAPGPRVFLSKTIALSSKMWGASRPSCNPGSLILLRSQPLSLLERLGLGRVLSYGDQQLCESIGMFAWWN